MGSGAVQEQNAADGAARQLFKEEDRGPALQSALLAAVLRVCPGLSPSRVCTFQV